MSSSKNMIYNSISFIESRLSDELSINELAGQIFFSKTHYKRLFQAVIGEPVMEYIKKRRLHRAGMMLLETDTSVLEIALQFGYASHEGFSRAFKEFFGMSPMQYRKRYVTVKVSPYHEEVMNMITNEARKNITRYAGDIAKDWETLITELEKCCAPVKNEIEKDRRVNSGMAVSFEEWKSLIARMNMAKNETLKLFAEETNVYELYDKADMLMITLDDIIFQMNLLRFLTGVEWSRMGKHGIPFEPVLEKLTTLCEIESKRKESAVKLVLEINALVQTEIKREAVGCLQQAADVMRERVIEGVSLTEKLNALVVEMGMNGRGFALIAKETEKAASCVRDAELFIQQLADEMNNKKSAHAVIKQISDYAFKMNVNAFNAAVETARAGEDGNSGCHECAEGIRAYAGQLQYAYKTCDELNKDCIKLMALLNDEDKNGKSRRLQKRFDDIIFQAEFLNTQLSLEVERTSREDFRTLSRGFEKALGVLKYEIQQNEQMDMMDMLKVYNENLLALIERGNTTAKAAGEYGVGISYILKEYSLFISRQ